MNDRDEKTARAWIRYQRNWWAFDEVRKACDSQPSRALRLLVRMAELATTAELVRDLGCGPLEDFVRSHAPKYIAQLERQSLSNPRFRRALKSVWLPVASDHVSLRLFALGVSPTEGKRERWQRA